MAFATLIRRATSVPALLLAGCVAGMGPIVDDDFCSRGFIDDQRLESDLNAQPAATARIESLSFKALLPPVNPVEEQRYHDRERWPILYSEVIDTGTPVVDWASGRSRVVAYDLTRLSTRPVEVIVSPIRSGTSLVNPNCRESGPHGVTRGILPVVQFLNKQRSPIGDSLRGVHTKVGPAGALAFRIPNDATMFLVTYRNVELGQSFTIEGDQYIESACFGTTCVAVPRDGTFAGRASSTGYYTLSFR